MQQSAIPDANAVTDAHIGFEDTVLAYTCFASDHTTRADHGAPADGCAVLDDRLGPDANARVELGRRADGGTRVDAAIPRMSRGQHGGNPCVGEVGIADDQRRHGAGRQEFLLEYHRGSTSLQKLGPVAPIRKEADIAGARVGESSDTLDAAVPVAMHLRTELFGDVPQRIAQPAAPCVT